MLFGFCFVSFHFIGSHFVSSITTAEVFLFTLVPSRLESSPHQLIMIIHIPVNLAVCNLPLSVFGDVVNINKHMYGRT
ncbi:hypothetical protein BDV37DRAFT_261539 [Aspergillus pseudonomiae]|uniref:Uncharacterized protein n=1 Tax=Aspergillus pseudonomiae TaxID=1506151 RepID=A0A5N7CY50_9EURO|nr:uncharacterized protein BDV37DRAFT_261539 [Aspergillus pseudonomiae]KAE8399126.1 hypothetical protein BDV37DRAFT_261539 [Aspergillus pseudonomiae]